MNTDVNVFTVANTFLDIEPMSNKKLQKMCYYAQGWHLAFYKEPLFPEEFEAWIHGPVCRPLYMKYRDNGWNPIHNSEDTDILTGDALEFIKMIYRSYGHLTGDDLEIISHQEDPWKNAREGIDEWEASRNIISNDDMAEFYWQIHEAGQV